MHCVNNHPENADVFPAIPHWASLSICGIVDDFSRFIFLSFIPPLLFLEESSWYTKLALCLVFFNQLYLKMPFTACKSKSCTVQEIEQKLGE